MYYLGNIKPNIVIFVSDDLGRYDIGYHGSRHLMTPNIDSLAADAVVLDRYYTQPLCSPSRGALLTGIHPIHSGTQHFVLMSGSPWGLPLKYKLLPQYLKDMGYNTQAIGKWHLGFFSKDYLPTSRGFDDHTGNWGGFEDYYNHWMKERGFQGLDFRHNLDVIRDSDGIYSTDYFTDKAIELISDNNNTRPLFLYMAYQAMHSANSPFELQAPNELVKKFSFIKDEKRRLFAATLYSMDQSIGRIVEQLYYKNILNNTIILFVSDNGGAISGFMENYGSNYPLRGTKGTLWEGGVRVPAFIWSPLLKNSGYISDSYIQVFDWLPTILEAIDPKVYDQNRHKFDGISQWKTLNTKKCQNKNQLLLNIDPIWNMSSIIINQWKLIQGSVPKDMSPESDLWSQSFDEDNDFKVDLQRNQSVVYKVLQQMNHPCELNNVAKSFPQIVTQLWQSIQQYNRTAVPPLNKPIDSNANPIYHNNTWDVWYGD
ncbi:arylsulfatase J-like [Oppia nitens]|uniref:arylsulfatase J-like n=1 Tax=Oppia nitens TaxID=1686743 RepID=UPI0023DAB2AA|nr:arylsulfatase J-like [Oppia nitens]